MKPACVQRINMGGGDLQILKIPALMLCIIVSEGAVRLNEAEWLMLLKTFSKKV